MVSPQVTICEIIFQYQSYGDFFESSGYDKEQKYSEHKNNLGKN